MSKKKLPSTKLEFDESFIRASNALDHESPRGVVLVATAKLDEMLEMLIRANLSPKPSLKRRIIDPLFEAERPLHSFSAKIRLAYAMELIEDFVFNDLEVIRKLRNELAAHSYEHFNFNEDKVKNHTNRLSDISKYIDDFSMALLRIDNEAEVNSTLATNRGRFSLIVLLILNLITAKARKLLKE